MKYVILHKGFGEGCDYTIGCNMRYDIIEFDGDIEELKHSYTMEALFGDEDANPEDYNKIRDMSGQISELIIIPITEQIVINMHKARKDHSDFCDELENKEHNIKELAEYERLRTKFGKGDK